MNDLRQKLLIELFRKFRDEKSWESGGVDVILTGTTIGTYEFGKRLGSHANTTDKIYKAVERYMEVGYTENDISIVEFYKRHYLETSLKKKSKQRVLDNSFMLRNEQKKKNLKFIDENQLVEHSKYKGFYGIKDGRVFSNKGAHGAIRELKPVLQKCNNGYYLICCGRDENGKANQILWHRFIAEIFIPNPNNLPQVNHLDEDKGNCCVDNLEWSTHVDNIRHSADNWGSDFLIQNIITGETSKVKNLMKWCKDNNEKYRSILYAAKGKGSYKNKYLVLKAQGTQKRGPK